MDPVVAIVGRPNVGKSSLFNRLIGRKRSMVRKEEGTTRDRIEARCVLRDASFTLVDTGGILSSNEDAISRQVRAQVKCAIQEAEILLFVVDVQAGLLPQDIVVADVLRRSSKPILLIANKADSEILSADAVDFYPLGFGEPLPVSSMDGSGFPRLKETLIKRFGEKVVHSAPPSIRIAVVGRPNVGKSSFLNALLHDDRLIVDVTPGTTRDPVDIEFKKGEKSFTFVDTAGIRRFSQIRDELLLESVRTTRSMIEKSDICLLLIDGASGIQGDDLRILQWILEAGRGVVLLVNKWDLAKETVQQETERLLRHRLGTLNVMPILFTSALTGKNVLRAIETAEEVAKHHACHFETHDLNVFLEKIRRRRDLLPGHVMPHVTYLVQVGSQPPRFLIFGSSRQELSQSFVRFLARKLRERFPLEGTPIQLEFRMEKKVKR